MGIENIVKTLTAMILDMDYADYLENAKEELTQCVAELEFLEKNNMRFVISVLRTLAENNAEALEWYENMIGKSLIEK